MIHDTQNLICNVFEKRAKILVLRTKLFYIIKLMNCSELKCLKSINIQRYYELKLMSFHKNNRTLAPFVEYNFNLGFDLLWYHINYFIQSKI